MSKKKVEPTIPVRKPDTMIEFSITVIDGALAIEVGPGMFQRPSAEQLFTQGAAFGRGWNPVHVTGEMVPESCP